MFGWQRAEAPKRQSTPMNLVGISLCPLNVISILRNYCYMYLLVLGYFFLGLRIFTEFFFSKMGFNTASYSISIWRNRYLFLSLRYDWVLLQPILHSILRREMGVKPLKLVSLNVKGISNFHKRKTIYTWCRRKNADFSFLLETHSKTEIETQWNNEWEAGIIMSHGSSNSRGVAILIKNWKYVDLILQRI